MKRKLLAAITTLALLFTALPAEAAQVVVKDQPLQTDPKPFIENDRTFVPMRAIFEALGAEVTWDANTRTVTGTLGDKVVTLKNPKIVNNRTVVPLRYISESLGSRVEWVQASETAYVDSKIPVNNFQRATVSRHVDGDTIHVNIDGRDYKLRMIGVDTPETKHPNKPVQYFGKEASAYTARTIPVGYTVWLQKDVSNTDRYGRLLRYVWLKQPATDNPTEQEISDNMLNAMLIANGYGAPSTYPPDVKYADLFNRLSQNARNGRWGLWGAPAGAPSNVYKQPAPAPKPSYTAPSYTPNTAQGVIKGNRRSRIYHLPGQQSYNKISAGNVVYFNSVAEAQAAGYRPAKR